MPGQMTAILMVFLKQKASSLLSGFALCQGQCGDTGGQ